MNSLDAPLVTQRLQSHCIKINSLYHYNSNRYIVTKVILYHSYSSVPVKISERLLFDTWRTLKLRWWSMKGSVCAVQNWTKHVFTPRRQVCKCLGECQCIEKVSISTETNVFDRSLGLACEWKKQKILMISLKVYLHWRKKYLRSAVWADRKSVV